eukprot:3001012-Rhodomonas_salina.2
MEMPQSTPAPATGPARTGGARTRAAQLHEQTALCVEQWHKRESDGSSRYFAFGVGAIPLLGVHRLSHSFRTRWRQSRAGTRQASGSGCQCASFCSCIVLPVLAVVLELCCNRLSSQET